MTLLIAMEFEHSMAVVTKQQQNIMQVKTVIRVSMPALARTFIIPEIHAVAAARSAVLAMALVVLGAVYRIVRERDAWNLEHDRQEEG